MPVNVGQAAVNAVMPEGKPLVIDAELVQNRGVDVVDLCGVRPIERLVAPLVARSVADPAAMPPPHSQFVNTYGLWSRPLLPCVLGMRPNSVVQSTIVSFSKPRCFKSLINAAVPTAVP